MNDEKKTQSPKRPRLKDQMPGVSSQAERCEKCGIPEATGKSDSAHRIAFLSRAFRSLFSRFPRKPKNCVFDAVFSMLRLTHRGPREDLRFPEKNGYRDESIGYALRPRGTRTWELGLQANPAVLSWYPLCRLTRAWSFNRFSHRVKTRRPLQSLKSLSSTMSKTYSGCASETSRQTSSYTVFVSAPKSISRSKLTRFVPGSV